MLPFGGQHEVQRFFSLSSLKSNAIREDLQPPQLLHHICTPVASPERTTRQSSAEKEVGQKHIPWSKWFSRLMQSYLLQTCKTCLVEKLFGKSETFSNHLPCDDLGFIAKALVSSVVLITTKKQRRNPDLVSRQFQLLFSSNKSIKVNLKRH